MLYPIKFESIYMDKIWGTESFKKYNREVPYKTTGEAWDLSLTEDNVSVVANGEHKGKTLKDLIDIYGYDFTGVNVNPTRQFPILIKLITSGQDLSVQVHPDDSYAKRRDFTFGNTEIWYVLDAEEGANIVLGTTSQSKNELFNLSEDNRLSNYLRTIDVKKGDFIEIPTGTIHAMGKNIDILEIKQNSEATYRIYDYGRRGQNQDRAKDIVNPKSKPNAKNLLELEEGETFKYSNRHFSVELLVTNGEYKGKGNAKSMKIITCIDGSGEIITKETSFPIGVGDSYIIPAKLKEFKIIGNCKLLRTTMKKERA